MEMMRVGRRAGRRSLSSVREAQRPQVARVATEVRALKMALQELLSSAEVQAERRLNARAAIPVARPGPPGLSGTMGVVRQRSARLRPAAGFQPGVKAVTTVRPGRAAAVVLAPIRVIRVVAVAAAPVAV